jgi:sec-independent protein translocase protein TatA
MIGTLGIPEMAVIFILALVLFGPKKLPELGRTIGKAMTEFRRASNDLKATFEREMQTLEREHLSIQETTRDAAREIAEATYEAVPPQSMWNPLEDVMKEEINLDPASDAVPAIETASTQESHDTPALVSASEVSGAESTPSVETAAVEPAPVVEHVGIEGTIPRGMAPEETPKTS